jgi:flagellar motility protein MotE (MotC chaperone)
MNIIETSVGAGHVRMSYASGATKEESSEWVEFRLKSAGDGNRRLGVIQTEALRRLRAVIDEEMKRLQALANQIHE